MIENIEVQGSSWVVLHIAKLEKFICSGFYLPAEQAGLSAEQAGTESKMSQY